MKSHFSSIFSSRPDERSNGGDGRPERQSISEQVANGMLAMIKSGNLKPGDRLPTEQQMTLALGISRPPLREALKALTLMGVLESRQGGRYTVTDLSPSRLVAPFNIMLAGKDYDAADHYEARSAVDLECVRFCAERAEPAHRARILHLAGDGHAFVDDPVGFRVLDYEFHAAIYAGSGNVFLETVARGLYDVGLDVRRRATLRPDVIFDSCDDHIRIAEAIGAGDAGGAVEAYRDHLDHICDRTIEVLAQAEAPTS